MIAQLGPSMILPGIPPKDAPRPLVEGETAPSQGQAAEIATFDTLVDGPAPVVAPNIGQSTQAIASQSLPALQTGKSGTVLPQTGNVLPPVSTASEPALETSVPRVEGAPTKVAGVIDGAARPSNDLVLPLLARFAGPKPISPAEGELVQSNPPIPTASARPVDVSDVASRAMSPELRTVLERTAAVLVQSLGAAKDGVATAKSALSPRPEVLVAPLNAIAPSQSQPVLQPALVDAPVLTPAPASHGQQPPQTLAPSATSTPHDFEAVVDRLSQARENVQPGRASLAVRHEDFGQVSLRMEVLSAGLKVALSAANPEFASAAQAALADRTGGERGDRPAHTPVDTGANQTAADNTPSHAQHRDRPSAAGNRAPALENARPSDGEAMRDSGETAQSSDGELYA